ncbi:uncharacterized protein BDV17DRAFT_273107 [Aspergillus undulatus]|uniref:uncharacterized protein n=1 Tax=Aspergillus undulatus TaxID=1810928 RepID=UPI003CCCEF9F
MKLLTLLAVALATITTTTAHTVKCGNGRGGGDAKAIREGIAYLRSKGDMTRTLGPGQCERPSCSWNSGIFWCNDDKKHSRTMKMVHMAEGAQVIYDECPSIRGRRGGIGGEVDHPDHWRVKVGYAEDNC